MRVCVSVLLGSWDKWGQRSRGREPSQPVCVNSLATPSSKNMEQEKWAPMSPCLHPGWSLSGQLNNQCRSPGTQVFKGHDPWPWESFRSYLLPASYLSSCWYTPFILFSKAQHFKALPILLFWSAQYVKVNGPHRRSFNFFSCFFYSTLEIIASGAMACNI